MSYSKSKMATLFFAVLHKFVKCDLKFFELNIKLDNTTPFFPQDRVLSQLLLF